MDGLRRVLLMLAAFVVMIGFSFEAHPSQTQAGTGRITGVITEAGGAPGGLARARQTAIEGSPVIGMVEMDFEGTFQRQRGMAYADFLRAEIGMNQSVITDPMSLIAPEYTESATDAGSGFSRMSPGGGTVEVRNMTTSVVTTTTINPDGSYGFTGLPVGRYKMNAYATGYVREWYNDYYSLASSLAFQVEDGETLTLNMALDPAGTVTGTVMGPGGIFPAANRRVMWVAPNHTSPIRCTNASGQYTLPDVPTNAAFTVMVDGDIDCASVVTGNPDEYWQDQIASRSATPLGFTSGSTTMSNINFTLEMGGRIAGTVFNTNGVTPINGASVFFYDLTETLIASTATNASGQYTSPYLRQGGYKILALPGAGFATEYYDNAATFAAGLTVNVVGGFTSNNVNFTANLLAGGGTGSLSGTVFAPNGITPVANATVNLWRWDSNLIDDIATTTTNGSGQYSFSNLSANEYIIEVIAAGYPDEIYQNRRFVYEGTRVNVPPAGSVTGINVVLDAGVSITGTIYDGNTNLPLENPTVVAISFDGQTETLETGNTDGIYELIVRPGTYTVYAMDQPVGAMRYYGDVLHIDDAKYFSATLGAPVSGIDITLGRNGEILGTVFQSNGVTRIPNRWIGIYPRGSSTGILFCSNALGDYRSYFGMIDVENVVMTSMFCSGSGNYIPEWWKESPDRDGSSGVTLTDDQRFQMDIDFTLDSPGSTISGHVYQLDGVTPIDGATVAAYQWSEGQSFTLSYAITDGAGAYQIVGLGTDDYYLTAGATGYDTEYYQNTYGFELADEVGATAGNNTPNIDFTLAPFGTMATVNGSATLQQRPSQPDPEWIVPLHVIITPTGGGAAVFDATIVTNQIGDFTVSGIPPGTYRVYAKYSHALSNTLVVPLSAGANVVDMGTLREGDADNDNRVILPDFSLLAASFGKTSGQAGFDARADFNDDGVVNLIDFSLLASNYNQMGSVP